MRELFGERKSEFILKTSKPPFSVWLAEVYFECIEKGLKLPEPYKVYGIDFEEVAEDFAKQERDRNVRGFPLNINIVIKDDKGNIRTYNCEPEETINWHIQRIVVKAKLV
jgi:hypothetical protein